jgi:trk system potassium uptake protein
MYVIVAGCGRVGSQLANQFSYEGHDVVIIDKDRASFRRLGNAFNGIALEGVAFDEQVMGEAGMDRADAFVAVTNYDNTNLMAAEIATNVYRVPSVISRLYNPDKELTFFKLGIDYVCGTTLMAQRILETLFQGEDVVVQLERVDLGLQLVEFAVPPQAEGEPAGNLDFGVSSRLIALVRDNHESPTDGKTTLRSGDRVVVSMRKEGWKVIRECLKDDNLESCTCPINIFPSARDPKSEFFDGEKPPRVVIGGCSQVGAYLAYLFSMEDYDVTVLESNAEKFKRLSSFFHGRTIEGNVYDEETLLKAETDTADAFVAVTKFDNTNLMASEIARHIFKVPNVVARVFNPDKEWTYQALGLRYVCGTRMMSQELRQRILRPRVKVMTSCMNNLFDLVEFECPAQWHGKTLKSAEDRTQASFAYVARRSSGLLPDDNLKLKKGDTISALGTPRKIEKLEKYLEKIS